MTDTSLAQTNPTHLESRVWRTVSLVRSDRFANRLFWMVLPAAFVVYFLVGRNQWFTRDDWASVITRETVLQTKGWQNWLFDPQDGHWLTVPFLIFAALRRAFGLGSYWPFLIPAIAAHVGSVLLTRKICQRYQVSAWTTTLVCSLLLLFGSGWENLIFAIQICYNMSLLVFLAQLFLVDHDGPVDRRDYIGAGLSLIGMMSSGFGPIFMVGILILLALRQRWKALLIAVVPQAAAYGWWLLTWSSDNAANTRSGNRSQIPLFVVRGVSATFDGMTSIPGLGAIALVATLATVFVITGERRRQTLLLALASTVVVMYSAIAFQRSGFGIGFATSSRYQHMAAMVIAPCFAVMIDRLGRISREARLAGLAVVAVSTAVNVSVMRERTVSWAIETEQERKLINLVAGSDLLAGANPKESPLRNSPDVTLGSIEFLREEGALDPRQPADQDERNRLEIALGVYEGL